MHHKTTILVAPALQNSSCTHPRYSQASFLSLLGPGDVLQALIVLLLTVGVLAANLLLILVINSRRYSKYIHSQVGKSQAGAGTDQTSNKKFVRLCFVGAHK
jgi:hypothetical protein